LRLVARELSWALDPRGAAIETAPRNPHARSERNAEDERRDDGEQHGCDLHEHLAFSLGYARQIGNHKSQSQIHNQQNRQSPVHNPQSTYCFQANQTS
jgi:hypothetical protein